MLTATPKPAQRKILLVPLIAATFLMVSGGPYGIEDILGGAGFGIAIVILVVLPVIWSLPTALMIGELASAIPDEGGYYVWVRRAMGPFWGYQESWLSLAASIFDMALYPSMFVLYLGMLSPEITGGWKGYAWKLAVVALCCAWNLLGAPRVGNDSVWMSALLMAPFAVFFALCAWRAMAIHPAVQWGGHGAGLGLSTAILVGLWNYMGWDNASTVAQEVENPQRNYPRAMIAAITLGALAYVLPLAAMAMAGLSVHSFTTGDWATAAGAMGGPLLGLAVVAGGCVTGIGMFNSLMMSYTRLPMAMAQDGMLPRVLARTNRRQVPWVSVLVCGVGWALALNLPFDRLISIDLILYGSGLLLEFAALVVLRLREPEMPRPFRAGNFAIACALGIAPAGLIAYALWVSRNERIFGTTSALLFATAIGLLGPILYWLTAGRGAQRSAAESAD